jgi:hypothetical protein
MEARTHTGCVPIAAAPAEDYDDDDDDDDDDVLVKNSFENMGEERKMDECQVRFD